MRLSFALCTLFLFHFVSLNSAQVFRFNGQFNDPSGQSVGGTTFVSSVMVQLFDHPVTGQSGYIQMEPSVQVVDGLFSLDIGPGLPDLNLYRYLELTISGETLSPRVPILVAPLSLKSLDSERFGQLTTDEFLQIVGNAILDESNFITDSLTTGLTILSAEIQNNSLDIGSLDGRLSSVEQNAGSNAALLDLSQTLQSQDLRLQDLELAVMDSQSESGATSLQLDNLSLQLSNQAQAISTIQGDITELDSSLALLQTTVGLLQSAQSQIPTDVLTSGETSFATSAVLNFVGSDMQLVIHSVLTDENAADKIVLFDSDGLEAFRVNAGGEVTATGYYGDGSGLVNLYSSQIADFVTAVTVIAGGPVLSTDILDFTSAVDGQIQGALAGASFDSSQISDFETAVDLRLLQNPMSSVDITDFETAVIAQGPNLILTSGQIVDLTTAVDGLMGTAYLYSAQISDLDTAIDNRLTGASFHSGQVSNLQTAIQNEISIAVLDSTQISDFQTATESVLAGSYIFSYQVSDLETAIDTRLSGATLTAAQIADFSSAANGAVTLTKADVGLANVDNVQQIPMSYLNTTVVDTDTEIPSSLAIIDYVMSEISTIDKTAIGLGSVQDIDVTTDFDQNPDASIGSNRIRAVDNRGLSLVNLQNQGVTVFDSTGHVSINTDVDLGGLTVHGNTDLGKYGSIIIEEATNYADAYIQLNNVSPSGRGYMLGVAPPTAGEYANKFYIDDVIEGASRLVIDSQGYVGISTISPQATLDVSGTLRLGTTTSEMGTDGTIRWNGSDLEVKMGGSWTSLLGGEGSSPFTDNSTNAIYDSGNLGLGAGAINPNEQLVLDGRLKLLSDSTAAGDDGTLRWTGTDLEVKLSGVWTSLTKDPANFFYSYIQDADSDTFVETEFSEDDDTLRFVTNGSESMTITATGSVGIGIPTPAQYLDVLGSAQVSEGLNVGFAGPATADKVQIGDADFHLNNSGTISTLSWDINDRSQYLRSSDTLETYLGGNLVTRMTATGLAIGDISPSEMLDVAGNIEANGNVSATDLLASGAVGVGTVSPTEELHIEAADPTILLKTAGGIGGKLHLGNASHGLSREFSAGANDVYLYTSGGLMSLSANGITSDYFTLNGSGHVGIGTNAPISNLHVASAAQVDFNLESGASNQAQIGFLHGGTAQWWMAARGLADAPNNRFAFFDSGAAERFTLLQGGNVGVGINNPTEKLHVAGNIKTTGSFISDGNGEFSDGLNVGYTGAVTSDTIGIGDANFKLNFNSGSPQILMDTDDYIALDRANNAYNFRVGSFDRFVINGNTWHVSAQSHDAMSFNVSAGNTSYSNLSFNHNAASAIANKWSLSSRASFDTPVDRLGIYNAGAASEVMSILQTGSVGIGTKTPNQKLHVEGNSFVSGSTQFGDTLFGADMITFSPNPSIYFDGTDYLLFNRATNDIAYATGNVEKIRFTAAGNLGINNAVPSQKLDVAGNAEVTGALNVGVEVASPTAGHIYLGNEFTHIGWFGGSPAFHFDTNDYIQYVRGSDDMRFVVNNADAMQIKSDGKIGIGNTSPGEKLDVSGAVKATSVVYTDNTSHGELVAFSARLSGNQSLTNNSETQIVWNVEDYDYGSNFNISTGEFTAPVKGIYFLKAQCAVDGLLDNKLVRLILDTSSGMATQMDIGTGSAHTRHIVASKTVLLTAGATAEVRMYHDTGTASNCLGAAGHSYFEGRLIRQVP